MDLVAWLGDGREGTGSAGGGGTGGLGRGLLWDQIVNVTTVQN